MMFCISDAFKEKWKDFKWKALVAAGLVSQPMDYSYHYIELGWTEKNFYVYIWADPYGGWWRTPPPDQKHLADVTGLDAKRGGPQGMQWKVKT